MSKSNKCFCYPVINPFFILLPFCLSLHIPIFFLLFLFLALLSFFRCVFSCFSSRLIEVLPPSSQLHLAMLNTITREEWLMAPHIHFQCILHVNACACIHTHSKDSHSKVDLLHENYYTSLFPLTSHTSIAL